MHERMELYAYLEDTQAKLDRGETQPCSVINITVMDTFLQWYRLVDLIDNKKNKAHRCDVNGVPP